MIYKICYYGNPILRKKAEEIPLVNEEIKQLIRDMEETMNATNGIGLAAPQIGVSLSLFIVAFPDPAYKDKYVNLPIRAFINPKIRILNDEIWIHDEGCLSIPGIRGDVPRPMAIEVTALNEEGNSFTEVFSGWNARMILHENDHLNGVLYIDRMHKDDRRKLEPYLRKIKTKYNP